jgi:hypothetical protein
MLIPRTALDPYLVDVLLMDFATFLLSQPLPWSTLILHNAVPSLYNGSLAPVIRSYNPIAIYFHQDIL